MTHEWAFPLIRPPTPRAFAIMSIQVFHPETWVITATVDTLSHRRTDQSLTEFCDLWGELLEQAGQALYRRARPALAVLTSIGEDIYDSPDLFGAGSRRRLVVGWRTWYGPAYVEKFGREWLLQLPDRAAELDDGGVYHQLAASATDLATDQPDLYDGVREFLQRHKVPPAWPRLGRPSGRGRDQADTGLTETRQMLAELLATTLVLENGRRVKMLPLEWASLSEPERRLALGMVREAIQSEMAEHPRSQLHVEFSELPADLLTLLQELSCRHPRLSFGGLDTPPGP